MQSTKKLTLKTKMISLLLSVVLAFGFVLPSAMFGVKANADASDWDQFSITDGIVTEYTLNDEVTLPVASGANVKVVNPRGTDITSSVVNNKFTASIAGQYQVIYTSDNGLANTGVIYINVVGSDATIVMPTNVKQIIPSKAPKQTTIVFPNPTLKDGDEEINGQATVKLIKAEAKDPITITKNNDGFYFYDFQEVGKYELSYSYGGEGTSYNKVVKKFTIEIVDSMTTKDDINYTLSSSMPTSAVQGVEVTLPTVIGKSSANDTIDVYTEITVKCGDKDVKVDDFKFVPTYAGSYTITYTVQDFFGNKISKQYTINNVKDSKAPTLRFVDNYVISAETTVDEETLVDIEETIPTQIQKGVSFDIPAIYASQVVVGYGDLTLERSIKNGSTVTAVEGNKNEKVPYTFNETGTYTLIFTAYETNDTTIKTTKNFTIKVVDDADTVAPTITVTDFVKDTNGKTLTEVEQGQEIKIAVPAIADLVNPEDLTSTDVYDSNPILKAYMSVDVINGQRVELELDEDGKYYLATVPVDATLDSQESNLVIEFEGIDHANNKTAIQKEIAIKQKASTDTPSFVTDFATLSTISAKQFEIVELFEDVQAKHATDKNLSIDVVVYDEDGNKVNLLNNQNSVKYDSNESAYIATQNGTFNATLAGEYNVVYIVKDSWGHYTVAGTTIEVAADNTPVITLSSYETTMELGEVVVPQAYVYVNGELKDDSWLTVIKTSGNINQNNSVVTYKYIAQDPDDVDAPIAEMTATFTVKDTKAPTIVFEDDVQTWASLDPIEGSSSLYQPIEVCAWSASDKGTGVDFSTIKITAKDNKGNTVKLIADGSEDEVTEIKGTSEKFKFVPTKDAKYTITYEVSDFAGNTTTETKTIAVGDVTAPTLTIKNESSIPTTAKLVNGKYTLSLNVNKTNVQIVDSKGGELDIDDHLTVTVTNSSGTTISGSDFNYELTTAGTYTVKYTAVDDADNTTVKTFTVTVSADSSQGATVTEVLGIILLIIAILVLAGVVWYFVKPAKKFDKQVVKTDKDEEKKND